MTEKDHRLGVSEVNLVVRHLKLDSHEPKNLQSALEEIDQLYGLDDVSFDEKSHILNLAYDATRLCIDGIEGILGKHNVTVSHDWWTRFKEGYYRFVDDNVKENATHEPWSCHQGPLDTNKK